MTVWTDNAHTHATRDRAAAADLVLADGVRRAIDHLRDGRPGMAEFILTKAAMSADRILGPTRPHLRVVP